MKHGQANCSVLGLGLFVVFHIRSLSATSIEALLTAQNDHEASSHADFLTWCHAAQSKLSDRVSLQKERIDELTGAIASYGEIADGLKNATRYSGKKPLDVLTQEQRLKLIQTESAHWRSVHAKAAAERLMKADNELLTEVDSALKWEEQALSKRQNARRQLLSLVHEKHIEIPVQQAKPSAAAIVIPAPVTEAPSEALIPVITPVAPAPPPVVSLRKPQPVLLHSVPKGPAKKSSSPRPSVVRANSEAVMQFPLEAAPIFGISQLPALQLMQADNTRKQGQGFSALQSATHAIEPKAVPETQLSATALLTPMLPLSESLESSSPKSSVQSVAQLSTGTKPQASVLSQLSSELATTPAPLPAAVPTATTAPEHVPEAKLTAAEKVDAVSAPVAPLSQASAKQPAATPKVEKVVASTSALTGHTAASPTADRSKEAIPASTAAVPAAPTNLESAIEKALPLPEQVQTQPVPKVAEKAPVVKTSVSANHDAKAVEQVKAAKPSSPEVVAPKSSPEAVATKSTKIKEAQDPEKALMAIMSGSSDEEDSTEKPPVAAAAVVAPKGTAAFLGANKPAGSAAKPVVKATAAPTSKDPEDALMEAMMSNGDGADTEASTAATPAPKVPSPSQKAVKQSPKVLSSAAQPAQPAHAAKPSAAKPIGASKPKKLTLHAQKQAHPDSAAGVMQSFIQEVSSLAQGEPGSDSEDPASDPIALVQEEPPQSKEAEDHMMKSFVQDVSRLAQGEASEGGEQVAPTTKTGLHLSSDLSSLMGLSESPEPASFLQIATRGQHRRSMSVSELAAASLEKDLSSSEVSKRLARAVSRSSTASSVQMLTDLIDQLQGRQFQWSCDKGPAASHAMAVLQLAETGTALLTQERDTITSLRAELRNSESESAQMKAEFVAMLEQTLGHGLEAASADLESLPLVQIQAESSVGASAIAALESTLHADASAAKELGSKFVDQGSEYVRLGDELVQTGTAKDRELKKAQKVLADARARAAKTLTQVAQETGCSDAARTSGLITAVYKALHILSD